MNCSFSLPVDYNRVILETEEGVPDSDYINASYVDVSTPTSLNRNIQLSLN